MITYVRPTVGSFWVRSAREENDTVLRLQKEYVNRESRFVMRNLVRTRVVLRQKETLLRRSPALVEPPPAHFGGAAHGRVLGLPGLARTCRGARRWWNFTGKARVSGGEGGSRIASAYPRACLATYLLRPLNHALLPCPGAESGPAALERPSSTSVTIIAARRSSSARPSSSEASRGAPV